MAGLRFPLSTLHVQPRGCPRMTRGHDGSATLFMWGSFIPYSMPVYPGAFTTSPFRPPFESGFTQAFTFLRDHDRFSSSDGPEGVLGLF